ncbi:MAG: small multi-drug export protein [Candidatus Omnitrophota bacterium]
MLDIIINWLKDIPKEYLVVIIGALPVSELRGAIPFALYQGIPAVKAFWLAVLGNILPVVPGLILLEPITKALRKFELFRKFFDWWFARTKRNSDTVQKYEALGLALFVAIPLPITGAWSGIAAASLFKIRFRYAVISIIAGIIGAGLIVSFLCALSILSWKAVVH